MAVKTQVLVSVKWQTPNAPFMPRAVALWLMLLLLWSSFSSFCILGPWSFLLIFLCELSYTFIGMFDFLCHSLSLPLFPSPPSPPISSISNCSVMGSFQTIIFPHTAINKVFAIWLKGMERDQERNSGCIFLLLDGRAKHWQSPKSGSLGEMSFCTQWSIFFLGRALDRTLVTFCCRVPSCAAWTTWLSP